MEIQENNFTLFCVILADESEYHIRFSPSGLNVPVLKVAIFVVALFEQNDKSLVKWSDFCIFVVPILNLILHYGGRG